MKLGGLIRQNIEGFVEGLQELPFFRILMVLLYSFVVLGFIFFLLAVYFDWKLPKKKKEIEEIKKENSNESNKS